MNNALNNRIGSADSDIGKIEMTENEQSTIVELFNKGRNSEFTTLNNDTKINEIKIFFIEYFMDKLGEINDLRENEISEYSLLIQDYVDKSTQKLINLFNSIISKDSEIFIVCQMRDINDSISQLIFGHRTQKELDIIRNKFGAAVNNESDLIS